MADPLTVAVHRCRFVDYDPSAVTALAFPPLPIPTSVKGKKPVQLSVGTLAVGHANGNIDLCDWSGDSSSKQAHQAWVIRKTISGPYPSKVDTLVFALRDADTLQENQVPTCSDLRLFSSGGGSDLIEWDLNRGCLRRTLGSLGGAIWSMACNPTSITLALGCEDGTIRLVDIADDRFTHLRRFDKIKCRILSLAWGPPKLKTQTRQNQNISSDSDSEEEEEWEDSWIVTGGSDSALRKWDAKTGRVLEKMGADRIKGEQTLVWAVGVLNDGTIVSGDSMGLVKFWDSRTCTQLQSFRGHDADVLCLTIGPEGSSVYTSGVDQKVTQFTFVKESNPPSSILSSTSKWVQTCSRRLHSHDVRALATWPPHATLPFSHKRKYPIDIAPILASGGLDMSVVVTPAALTPATSLVRITNPLATSLDSTFEESYQRKLAYPLGASGTKLVCIAKEARLVSCLRDASASFWRIPPRRDEEDSQPQQDGWEKVLDMEFDVSTNLVTSAISDDGRWFAVSDWYSSKLYELQPTSEGGLKPKRQKGFGSLIQSNLQSSADGSTGAVSFCFTPDSKKLIMSTTDSYVLIIDLGETPSILRKFDYHHTQKHNASVLRLAVSPDGQWLASSDDCGRTNAYNVDSLQHHCLLPTFPHPAQTLSFDPHRPSLLILAFPNNTLQFYDVENRTFPPWCKNLTDSLSPRFRANHEAVLGVTFDPSPKADYALFWGSSWLCKVRLDESQSRTTSKRRRDLITSGRGDEDQYGVSGKDFRMITSYRPILGVEFLAEREMVVVERPLVDVLARLPPAYFKHKYGKS